MGAIKLNGAERAHSDGQTVSSLVEEVTGRRISADGTPLDGRRLGVAVAVNSEVVPRSRWSATAVAAGDDVEIVTAVQGG